jgi:Tfp pilus assembly protein PilW
MKRHTERGTSLFELMFVIILLFVTMGVIFSLVGTVMQRASTEQVKTDMFQEAREFMDQMSLDLRQAGYPNIRSYPSSGVVTASPADNDTKIAVGLVKVADGDLWIEGDMDGSGVVSVVHYHLDTSTTDNCPCLKRSQQPKITGNPLSGQTTPVYQMEVQGILNTNIFSAFTFGSSGTPITLPIDYTTNPTDIASADTIKIMVTVQGVSADPRTGQKPVATLVSTVKLANCSQAATGLQMSCQ